jgi:hypothetical protein
MKTTALTRFGVIALAFVMLGACGEITVETVPVPTSPGISTPVPHATRMASLVVGEFSLEDGCMSVIDRLTGIRTTLVVPLDQFSVVQKSNSVLVTDLAANPNTAYEWISGAEIDLMGGSISMPEKVPHSQIAEHCPTNFFLVGSAH